MFSSHKLSMEGFEIFITIWEDFSLITNETKELFSEETLLNCGHLEELGVPCSCECCHP